MKEPTIETVTILGKTAFRIEHLGMVLFLNQDDLMIMYGKVVRKDNSTMCVEPNAVYGRR